MLSVRTSTFHDFLTKFGNQKSLTLTIEVASKFNSAGFLRIFSDHTFAGDFNGDGVQDLAMGSYGYGVGELEQVGAVFILPGGTLPVNPVTVLDDATDTS